MAHTDLENDVTTLVVEGWGQEPGSPGKCGDLSLTLLCLIPLTWEGTAGPGHTGDARLGSAFRLVAEASVLRIVGEEAVVFAVDPGREDRGHLQKVPDLAVFPAMWLVLLSLSRGDFLKSPSTER